MAVLRGTDRSGGDGTGFCIVTLCLEAASGTTCVSRAKVPYGHVIEDLLLLRLLCG